ncbi:hypothetical protein ACIPLC_15580 [Kitasatospora sp. NPDC086801]|uniref:hypothetical protein n=1 Tax=unclassified Kitasatospora TaxID=2633591 RepID=UPI003816A2C0
MDTSQNLLAGFGAVMVVLGVGHVLADHVLGQTDRQAARKAAPSDEEVAAGVSPRRGWGACLSHCLSYHLVLVGLYGAIRIAVPLPATALGSTTALAWSFATHAILDRRWPVRWILRRLGSPQFADLRSAGLNGLYLADQALHRTALIISAVLLVRL